VGRSSLRVDRGVDWYKWASWLDERWRASYREAISGVESVTIILDDESSATEVSAEKAPFTAPLPFVVGSMAAAAAASLAVRATRAGWLLKIRDR